MMVTASLAACVSFGAKAPPTLLVLSASSGVQSGATQSGSPANALIVLQPEASRKIDTTRVPVQIDASNIAYLKDALWADKPARMMQMLLMETISAKTGRLVLNEVRAGAADKGGFLVALEELEVLFFKITAKVLHQLHRKALLLFHFHPEEGEEGRRQQLARNIT